MGKVNTGDLLGRKSNVIGLRPTFQRARFMSGRGKRSCRLDVAIPVP